MQYMIVGVVGKPNCGKSTFFKACTLMDVEIANYPFATIKPNHGIGFVRVPCADAFFKVQCNPREGYCINHIRFVPVNIIDVAGLVPGAHEGKGMGNQFLDDLRQADVLIHVIDISGGTNEKGEPIPPGSYDPAEDIRFLEIELDMWYLQIIKRGWEKFARQIVQEHLQVEKALAKQLSGLGVTENMVKDTLRKLNLNNEKPDLWLDSDLASIARELRRITKPMLIAANKIDVFDANLERIKREFPEYMIVGCSAASELALKEGRKKGLVDYIPGEKSFKIVGQINDRQKAGLDFIREVMERFDGTGVQKVLDNAVFEILKYIAVFPGGVSKLEDQYGRVLPDCFLMPPGTTALDFAYKLHTDFGKNFIKAIDVKTRMPVGKEHKLKMGDVIEIYSGK
ncbi:MAG: redox-regulated ATPase YchF [Candidatus Woesearchaeota archaeon]